MGLRVTARPSQRRARVYSIYSKPIGWGARAAVDNEHETVGVPRSRPVVKDTLARVELPLPSSGVTTKEKESPETHTPSAQNQKPAQETEPPQIETEADKQKEEREIQVADKLDLEAIREIAQLAPSEWPHHCSYACKPHNQLQCRCWKAVNYYTSRADAQIDPTKVTKPQLLELNPIRHPPTSGKTLASKVPNAKRLRPSSRGLYIHKSSGKELRWRQLFVLGQQRQKCFLYQDKPANRGTHRDRRRGTPKLLTANKPEHAQG